jgi:hypothetical protein
MTALQQFSDAGYHLTELEIDAISEPVLTCGIVLRSDRRASRKQV